MKKIISLVMVIAVIFTLGAGISVFADFDFLVPADGLYVHYVTEGEDDTIQLVVYPYYAGSYSTSTDAHLTWEMVAGSTTGVTVDTTSISSIAYGENQFRACVDIDISDTAAPGAAAVKATDRQGNYVTIVFVINPSYGTSDYVTGVSCYYYDARSSTENLKATVTGISAQWNTHYSETNYISALDATLQSDWNSTAIDSIAINTAMSPNPYIVDSVKFLTDTETLKNGYSYYTNNGTDADDVVNYNMGWQYRVYRNNAMVALSVDVGPNQFKLQNNDVIIWKFGDYSTVTFPATLN